MAKRTFGRKKKNVDELSFDGIIEYLGEKLCSEEDLKNDSIGTKLIEEAMASASPKKASIKCLSDRILINKARGLPTKKHKIELLYTNLRDLRKINTTIGIRHTKGKKDQAVYEIFKFPNNKDTLTFLKIVIKEYKEANANTSKVTTHSDSESIKTEENPVEDSSHLESNLKIANQESAVDEEELVERPEPKRLMSIPSIVLSDPENQEEKLLDASETSKIENEENPQEYKNLDVPFEFSSKIEKQAKPTILASYTSEDYEWTPQNNKDFGIFFSDSDSEIDLESEKLDKKDKNKTTGVPSKNEDKQTAYYLKLIAAKNEYPYSPKSSHIATGKVQSNWGNKKNMTKTDINDFYTSLISTRQERVRQTLLQKHQEKQISQFRNVPVVGVNQSEIETYQPIDRTDVYKNLPNQSDDDFHRFPNSGMQKVKVNPIGEKPDFQDVLPAWLKNTIFRENEGEDKNGVPRVKIIHFDAEEYDEQDRLVTTNPTINKRKPAKKTMIDSILDLPLFADNDLEDILKKKESVDSKDLNGNDSSKTNRSVENEENVMPKREETEIKLPSWLHKIAVDIDRLS